MKKNIYLLVVAVLFAGAALLFRNQLGTVIWWVFIALGAGSLICYIVLKYKYQLAIKKMKKIEAINRNQSINETMKKTNYNQKKGK